MIEIILDASQIEVIETCPRKWYYDTILNLTTRSENPALSTGSFYHSVLEFYYRNYSDPARLRETFEFAKSNIHTVASVAADPEFHLERIKQYLIRWAAEEVEVVAVEKGFSQLLYEDSERRYILEGMIDLVYRSKGLLWVRDHKTQSRDYDKYPYCHQALNYLLATKADYFEYNYIGLQKNIGPNTFRHSDPFKAGPGVLDQWKLDVKSVFDSVARFTVAAESHWIDTVPDERIAYPKQRTSCQTKFGLCQFHKICEVPETDPLFNVTLSAYKRKERKWKPWA